MADVNAVLTAAFGNPPTETPKPIKYGRNDFKQMTVQANNRNYVVNTFSRRDGGSEYDAALIWDSPVGGKPDTQAMDMTMKSFAMGPK